MKNFAVKSERMGKNNGRDLIELHCGGGSRVGGGKGKNSRKEEDKWNEQG